jgi:DNA-binding response OmpR family regulator
MPRVHVIDDDAVTREVLTRVLADAGWEVSSSADGRAALADVAATRPDVVLLDVTMPGPDGWTVLGRLRDALPATKVVMLTGRTSHDDVVRARRAGAEDFVAKGVDPTLLLERLQAVLQRPPGRSDLLL